MTAAKFTGLVYESNHPELLELIGLADPDANGVVTAAESRVQKNSYFSDFFTSLDQGERDLLNSFDANSPLGVKNFRNNPELAEVVLKRIVFFAELENIEGPGFPPPEELEKRLAFDLSDAAEPLLDAVVIDVGDLSKHLGGARWQALLADPAMAPTPTLAVLGTFISQIPSPQTLVTVSFQRWREACAALDASGEASPNAFATWAELENVWMAQTSLFHGPPQHMSWHVVEIIFAGLLEDEAGTDMEMAPTVFDGASRLPLLSGKILDSYLSNPSAFALAEMRGMPSSDLALFRTARVKSVSRWPDEPRSLSLWQWPGDVSQVRLESDPGATVSSFQSVSDGALRFYPGQPLLKLDGFHLQLFDETPGVAKYHKILWDAFVQENPLFGYDIRTGTWLDDLPREVDLEGLEPRALSIVNGKLCFVFTGEAGTRDAIKPWGDDVYALDVGHVLVKLLGFLGNYGWLVRSLCDAIFGEDNPACEKFLSAPDHYATLVSLIFDEDDRVRADVPIDLLQEAMTEALAGGDGAAGSGGDGAPRIPAWDGVATEVRADGITADLSTLLFDAEKAIKKSGAEVSVTELGIRNGKARFVHSADASLSPAVGDWFVEGMADIDLGLSAPGVSGGDDGVFTGRIYFHYDALVSRGYAQLVLPEVGVHGVSSQADGDYRGKVTVGFEFGGEAPGLGGPSLAQLVSSIAVDAVIAIKKDRADFFAAAVKIRDDRTDDGITRVHQLLVDNDIALYDGQSGLYGVLSNGTFSEVQAYDGDNNLLREEFNVVGSHVVVGGIGNFFGDGMTVEVRHFEDGSYVVRPRLSVGNLENNYQVNMGNVGGELVVTPIYGDDGRVDHFAIESRNLAISISDAQLEMRGTLVRGRMDAVLNGTWESQAPNLVELLMNGRDWRGHGTLKMVRTDNDLLVTDAKGRSFDFASDRIDTVFEIGAIEFNPLKGRGSLTETIHHGDIVYDAPQLKISSDVSGTVNVSGKYPLVRMEVLQLIADGAQNTTAVAPLDAEALAAAERLIIEGNLVAAEAVDGNGDFFPSVTREKFIAAEIALIIEGVTQADFLSANGRDTLSQTFLETTPVALQSEVMAGVIADLRRRGLASDADILLVFPGVAPSSDTESVLEAFLAGDPQLFINAVTRLILSCPGGMAGILEAFPEMSRELFIKAIIDAVADELHDSSLLAVDPAFFASEEFPLEALFASIEDLSVAIESMPVAPGLDYKSRGHGSWGRYPAFTGGLLRWFNPAIHEGTSVSSSQSQDIFRDGKLVPFRFDFYAKDDTDESSDVPTSDAAAVNDAENLIEPSPIRFLGINFTGIGVEEKFKNGKSAGLHLYIYTRHGKVDLIGLLRLLFPRKVKRLYDELKNSGVTMPRNGVPSDLGAFAQFLRAIERTFNVDDVVRDAVAAQKSPFVAKEFHKLRREEFKMVWDKLLVDGPRHPLPRGRGGKDLAMYLNTIAADPKFEEHFLSHMEVFTPKSRGMALIYLEEIRRLRKYRFGEDLTRAEAGEISGYHYLILRILLKQYLPNTDVIDFDNTVATISLYGKPKAADYAWFAFEQDADVPLHATVKLDKGNVEIAAANGEGEAIQNVSLDILSPIVSVSGHVDSVSDFDMAIGPPAENGIAAVSVSFGKDQDAPDDVSGNGTVSDISLVVMDPETGMPTVAILPMLGGGVGFNEATGVSMSLTTQLDKRVMLDLSIGAYHSSGSLFYVNAPILDGAGNKTDMVDVLAALNDVTLPDISVHLDPLYDVARPWLLNDVQIEGGVVSSKGMSGMFFTGRAPDDARRHSLAQGFSATAHLNIDNQNVTVTGYANVTIKPPVDLAADPAFQALQDAGIGIDIDEAVFDGTFAITVNGGGRGGTEPISVGLTRAAVESTEFVPTSLTLRGTFTFETQDSRVTVTEIRVPIEEFAVQMIGKDPNVEDSVTRAVLQTFKIPAGDLERDEQAKGRPVSNSDAADKNALTAAVSGSIHIPPQYGIRDATFDEAVMRVAFPQGFSLTRDATGGPVVSAPGGALLHVSDTSERNVIDLATGTISYLDDQGVVQTWRLDAKSRDLLVKTAVTAVLRGSTRFETTPDSEADAPHQ